MQKPTEKILVIKHGAFGDLIQADGVLRDIRNHYPQAEIVLLTSPEFESLMHRCPHIDRILTDSRSPIWQLTKHIALSKTLKHELFTQIIDLQNSDRTRLYRRYILPKSHWIARLSGLEPESGLKGQLALLKQANIPIHHAYSPNVSWMADNISFLLTRHRVQSPYIALIPGCSVSHPEKRWPFYKELATALLKHGFDVVNILGPDELEMADHMPGHCLTKQHGLFSWFELAGILNQASFVIGNDTGPSHVASCLGKQGLALFGAHSSVTRAEIRRGDFRALKANDLSRLSVETVLAAVLPKLPTPIQPPTTLKRRPNYSVR